MTKTALQFIQQGWTQGTDARDKHGVEVGVNSDDAVCWCSIGAITAVYGYGPERNSAIERFEEMLGSSIASWNDKPCRTKKEVIDAFVKAGI